MPDNNISQEDKVVAGNNAINRLLNDENFKFESHEEIGYVVSSFYAAAREKGLGFERGSFAITPPELAKKLHDSMIDFYANRDYSKNKGKIPNFVEYLFSKKDNSLYSRKSSHYKNEKIAKQYGIDYEQGILPTKSRHLLFGYIDGQGKGNGRLFVKTERRGVGKFWDAILHLLHYFEALGKKRDTSLTKNEKDVPQEVHKAFYETLSYLVDHEIASESLKKMHKKLSVCFDENGELKDKKKLPKYAINRLYSEVKECLDEQEKKLLSTKTEVEIDKQKSEMMDRTEKAITTMKELGWMEKPEKEETSVNTKTANLQQEKDEIVGEHEKLENKIDNTEIEKQFIGHQSPRRDDVNNKLAEMHSENDSMKLSIQKIRDEIENALFKAGLDKDTIKYRQGNEVILDLTKDFGTNRAQTKIQDSTIKSFQEQEAERRANSGRIKQR